MGFFRQGRDEVMVGDQDRGITGEKVVREKSDISK
jgi:hypothetical protein